MSINYQMVSVATVLRDYVDVKYLNKEQEMLVDIADCFWNADLCYDNLKDEYKALYDEYGEEFFDKVFADIQAIKSQLGGIHSKVLALEADYNDLLRGE